MAKRAANRRERQPRRSSKQLPPTLGRVGLSIFRSADAKSLEAAVAAFEEATRDRTTRLRGRGADPEAALSIVELNEVKRQHKAFNSIDVHDAHQAVYRQVPELRRSTIVKTSRVAIFGAPQAPFVHIGFGLTIESRQAMLEDRHKVIGVLESLSTTARTASFQWDTLHNPHVSLGMIPRELIDDVDIQEELFETLDEARPAVIGLARATLYLPKTYHRRDLNG